MRIITIERQYGSGGREIGRLLSAQLGIPCYDRDLLPMAAERAGLNPGVLHELDEKPTPSFLYNVAVLYDGYSGRDHAMLPYKAFEAEADTIRRLADAGPCIFIGRCAGAVLAESHRPARVFIYASNPEDRVRRAGEADGVPAKTAPAYIARKDKQRKDYYKHHTQQEWDDWNQYDLCLNSSALGYEGCAEIIRRLAERP